MTNQRELPRLPQARMYLKSAQWGIDELVAKRLSGYGFRLYLVGILASLRTVQHALKGHDRTLSEQHRQVIDEWWRATPLTVPELHFIRTSRNLILKTGAFSAYATSSESAIGEGPNREITRTGYDLAYYDQTGERQDLEEAIRSAIRWCDRELTAMEAKLPPVYAPE